MQIKVTNGIVTSNGKDYKVGETLDVEKSEAERLIKLGFSAEAGSKKPESPPDKSGNDK